MMRVFIDSLRYLFWTSKTDWRVDARKLKALLGGGSSFFLFALPDGPITGDIRSYLENRQKLTLTKTR
jgi:hypothetical protein